MLHIMSECEKKLQIASLFIRKNEKWKKMLTGDILLFYKEPRYSSYYIINNVRDVEYCPF